MPIIPPEKKEPIFDAAAGTHTRVSVSCDVTGEERRGEGRMEGARLTKATFEDIGTVRYFQVKFVLGQRWAAIARRTFR